MTVRWTAQAVIQDFDAFGTLSVAWSRRPSFSHRKRCSGERDERPGVAAAQHSITAQQGDDKFRGRVFSICDLVFSPVFVAAAGLTALVLPENGRSVLALVVIAISYLLTGLGYMLTPEPISRAAVATRAEVQIACVGQAGRTQP